MTISENKKLHTHFSMCMHTYTCLCVYVTQLWRLLKNTVEVAVPEKGTDGHRIHSFQILA